MLCVPVDRVEMVKAATPPLSARFPSFVVPSMKFTLPTGVPVVVDFTVAVNVTVSPEVDGFADDTTLVVLPALLITWERTDEVLVENVALPE